MGSDGGTRGRWALARKDQSLNFFDSVPPGCKPRRRLTIRFNRAEQVAPAAALAVDNHSRVFRKVSEYVRLHLVLFVLGIVSRHSSAVIAPGLFDHALFS